jgi:hypothetical protein
MLVKVILIRVVIPPFCAFQISETDVIQPQNDAASLVDPSEVRLFIPDSHLSSLDCF